MNFMWLTTGPLTGLSERAVNAGSFVDGMKIVEY
jgi:hypothetical protein